jgi:hypothetical protein
VTLLALLKHPPLRLGARLIFDAATAVNENFGA